MKKTLAICLLLLCACSHSKKKSFTVEHGDTLSVYVRSGVDTASFTTHTERPNRYDSLIRAWDSINCSIKVRREQQRLRDSFALILKKKR